MRYDVSAYRSVLGPVNVRLHGTGRVADDLYLIAHHEVTGRPYLSPRVLGAGLAGGLLAEVMTAGEGSLITLDDGCIRLTRDRGNTARTRYAGEPGEPLTRQVVSAIASEPQSRPVRDWLLFIGQTSADMVAGRLQLDGYLSLPRKSRIPGRFRSPVPGEPDWALCAVMRARAAAEAAKGPPTSYGALLAGLALGCGLGFRLASFAGAPLRDTAELLQLLRPGVRELVAHVQATAATLMASPR
jgi:hypothetical protein